MLRRRSAPRRAAGALALGPAPDARDAISASLRSRANSLSTVAQDSDCQAMVEPFLQRWVIAAKLYDMAALGERPPPTLTQRASRSQGGSHRAIRAPYNGSRERYIDGD